MVERASTDRVLTGPERATLGGMRTDNRDRRARMFSAWRNMHFVHAVQDAAAGGVRFAGMGLHHMRHLQNIGALPAGSHTYDMTGAALQAFERRTARLLRGAPR
jgi:hypothetical protein